MLLLSLGMSARSGSLEVIIKYVVRFITMVTNDVPLVECCSKMNLEMVHYIRRAGFIVLLVATQVI